MFRTRTRSPTPSARHPFSDVHDPAADVGPLDARELQGGADHVASASSAVTPASPVPEVTDFEYQPMRVFMSVLLTPAAATRTSTRPVPAGGPARRSGTRGGPARRGR